MKLAALVIVLAACQHDIKTPFPPGLEPLEDDPIPEASPPYSESVVTEADDASYIRIYGRGYVLAPPATVWAAAQSPDPNVAICSTTSHTVTLDDEPQYEYSFLVHYEVDDVVTVTWDDAWRFGVIDGTDDAPTLAMIKHQKIDGSSFISLSEGTIELTATDDPGVTELAFVEHLDSVGASDGDVLKGVQHNFASLAAVSHGNPVPPCP
ncbi:MAG TPA: hypothetical protein VLX92_03030 [Kofleriaceae bacterium]|nr:hypothetical protein [Kofleriaceae bacterium]